MKSFPSVDKKKNNNKDDKISMSKKMGILAAAAPDAAAAISDEWRRYGETRRKQIVEEDEVDGGYSFHLSRKVPVRKYFKLIERIVGQFRTMCTNIEQEEESFSSSSNSLEDAYVMGHRLIVFLSQALPKHPEYLHRSVSKYRNQTFQALVWINRQMDDIALKIDEEQLNLYITNEYNPAHLDDYGDEESTKSSSSSSEGELQQQQHQNLTENNDANWGFHRSVEPGVVDISRISNDDDDNNNNNGEWESFDGDSRFPRSSWPFDIIPSSSSAANDHSIPHITDDTDISSSTSCSDDPLFASVPRDISSDSEFEDDIDFDDLFIRSPPSSSDFHHRPQQPQHHYNHNSDNNNIHSHEARGQLGIVTYEESADEPSDLHGYPEFYDEEEEEDDGDEFVEEPYERYGDEEDDEDGYYGEPRYSIRDALQVSEFLRQVAEEDVRYETDSEAADSWAQNGDAASEKLSSASSDGGGSGVTPAGITCDPARIAFRDLLKNRMSSKPTTTTTTTTKQQQQSTALRIPPPPPPPPPQSRPAHLNRRAQQQNNNITLDDNSTTTTSRRDNPMVEENGAGTSWASFDFASVRQSC